MKRTSLLLASGGAVVVLSMTGAALGVALNDASTPPRGTSLVADDTVSPSEPPFESPSTDPSESPTESPTVQPFPSESSSSGSPPAGRHASGRLSANQAAKIALAHAGGGRVIDIEAEFEHGRPVWKVELVKNGAEYRVDVDRQTGAVLRFRLERAARDGDDRHGDDNSGSGSGDNSGSDDNSGSGSDDNSGSGSGSDDNSGRDHPEDD